MPLLRVVHASLNADAILVFSWVGDDTAIVRDASSAAWKRAVLSLPYAAIQQSGGVLLTMDASHRLLSPALAPALPFTPTAALAVQSLGDSAAPHGGVLALWASAETVPARIAAATHSSCRELGRLADQWLQQHRESHRLDLFEQIIQRIPDAMIFDPEDGSYALVNDTAAALLSLPAGRVPAAYVAMRMRDVGGRLAEGDAREAPVPSMRDLPADVRDVLWTVPSREPNAERQCYRVSCVHAPPGGTRGRIWTFRDVTAEQRAIRVLEEHRTRDQSKQAFLEGMLEVMHDAVLAVDADGTPTLMNTAARERYGIESLAGHRHPIDHPIGGILPTVRGATLPVGEHPLRRALLGEDVTDVELHTQHGQERRDLLVSAHAVRDADGAVVGAVVVERDITARNALEAHGRQREKLDALGRMAAGVTHDLNNLLTVVQTSALLLAAGAGSVPPADDPDVLLAAVEECRVLTRSLLDFCRGRIRQTAPVNMVVLLERLRGLLRRLVPSNVTLHVERSTGDALCILGDAAEMEQVVFTLCTNAADAMPEGGTLHMSVRAAAIHAPLVHPRGIVPAGDYVILQVSDTGIGMHPDVVRHAFDPFYTTKAAGLGAGLGLSTVHGIVGRCGGHVVIHSVLQHGTTFDVYLPRHPEERAERRPLDCDGCPAEPGCPVARAISPYRPDAVGCRVLLVDDDAMVRRAVARMVQHAGYDVTSVASAAEALDATARESFAVILSDVQMPGMDGMALAQALYDRDRHIPVVLMSGYANLDDAQLREIPTVVGFLAKPFSADEIGHRLRWATASAPADGGGGGGGARVAG